MLSFRSVTKVYPPQTVALNNIDLEVGKGEFVFLVGHSGAGKTTLLRMVYREEVPSSGTVFMNGWEVPKLSRRRIPFLRRHIGMVFQDFRLLPQRSVFDNVAFALRVTEEAHRDLRRRVMESLEIVGIADNAPKFPEQLSAGEQQRVGIARAIVGHPLVLLGDEPTGNLDPDTAAGIMNTLIDINRLGTTVLMATHSAQIVNAFRQRVVELDSGRLVRDELGGTYAARSLEQTLR